MNERVLAWDGCINARDLGGLRIGDGRTTCLGRIVRSDTPSRLRMAGWAALHDYGIRTIITLRTDGMVEKELDVAPPYSNIAVLPVAIEDITDREFLEKWAKTELWGTPLYYQDALNRWPQRHAAVIAAIARAGEGGVLFHCIRGHDRTGIIALLLLALAGVLPEEIAADYALSPDPERDALLACMGTSTHDVILGVLAGLDAERYLLAGGVRAEELAAVRSRLIGE